MAQEPGGCAEGDTQRKMRIILFKYAVSVGKDKSYWNLDTLNPQSHLKARLPAYFNQVNFLSLSEDVTRIKNENCIFGFNK